MSAPHQILDSDDEDHESQQGIPSSNKKRRNRIDVALCPGGTGGKARSVHNHETPWHFSAPAASSSSISSPLAPVVPPAPAAPVRVPAGSRSVIDNLPLANLIENNALCKLCPGNRKDDLGKLCLSHPTGQSGGCGGGFATRPKLSCDRCGHEAQVPHATTSVPHGPFNHKKGSDDPVNMALAMSMVAHGDGGTEAGAVLGFLDLCHPTSYEIGLFHNMEKELIFYAESIGESALRHAAFKEVEKSLAIQESGFDFERWKQAVLSKDLTYPKNLYARVRASDDMGWNKRGSGKRRDSHSGHCIAIGCESGLPIAMASMVNWCRICDSPRHRGPQGLVPPAHKCCKNFDPALASGDMEPAGLLEMMHHLWDHLFLYMFEIATDDDSKMKARCRWNNDEHAEHFGQRPMVLCTTGKKKGTLEERSKLGRLRHPIPEPRFWADPAHRKKTF